MKTSLQNSRIALAFLDEDRLCCYAREWHKQHRHPVTGGESLFSTGAVERLE
jgi:hypothetical protein